MSQHDFILDNAAGAAFRADANLAIQALASQSSGASAPGTMYAYQRWADTTTGVVKRRNAANSAWVIDGTLIETYAVARSSDTILAAADQGKFFRATASFTQTLTAAATLGDGWWCHYRVDSGASITFDPNSSEQIDGGTTKAVVGPQSGIIFCNGSAFFTYGFGVTTLAAANVGSSSLGSSTNLINGTLVHSRAGNAETIAIKTLAGADPSASDPVLVVFRNVTAATGDYAVITLTAATSVTISSGSTLGFTSAVAGRLWIVGFNDGGTFRLGVINCLSKAANAGSGYNVTSIYPLKGWGIASSTAEGGAGAADSAQVFYTGAGVTSKAYTVLGYSTWESGLTTAGTWDAAPTRTQLFGPGVPLPGNVIQVQRTETGTVATGTTVIPGDNSIPQSTEGDQYMSQAITPSSAANALRCTAQAFQSNSSANPTNTGALFRDAVANAIATTGAYSASTGIAIVNVMALVLASATSAITIKYRGGANAAGTTTFNGAVSAQLFGGSYNSYLEVNEVMA